MLFSLREICFYRVQCSSIMKTALQFTLRDQSKLECSLDSFLKTTKNIWIFSKNPLFVTKTFSFRENLHFNNSKCVFPAFCTIFEIHRDPCMPANVMHYSHWLCDRFELDALIPCVLFNTMNLPLVNLNTSGDAVITYYEENGCIGIWICKRKWWLQDPGKSLKLSSNRRFFVL